MARNTKNDKYRDLPIFPLILLGLFIDATNTANSHSLLPNPFKDFRPILAKKMGTGEKRSVKNCLCKILDTLSAFLCLNRVKSSRFFFSLR
jgi:hypothetical protein